MKRLRRLGLILLGLALLAGLGASWLFGTAGGRDFVLARVQAALPPGALQVGRAEGTLAGGLQLADVRLALDDLRLSAGAIELELAPWALLGRDLHLRRLRLRDVVHAAARPPTAPEPFVLPERLPWPTLALPVALRVDALAVIAVDGAGADGTQRLLDRLDASLQLDRDGALRIDALDARLPGGRLSGAAAARLAGRPDLELRAEWRRSGADAPGLTLVARPDGDGIALAIDVAGAGSVDGHVAADLDWRLDGQLAGFDPAAWRGDAPGVPLDLSLSARGSRLDARIEGRLRREAFEVALSPASLRWTEDLGIVLVDAPQIMPSAGGTLALSGRWQGADAPSLEIEARLSGLVLAAEASADAPRLDGRLRLRGPLDALQLTLDEARLARDGLAADVAVEALLGSDGARIDRLSLSQPIGRLAAEGELGWSPALKGALAVGIEGFDSGLLAADWPGRIHGSFDLRIEDGAQGLDVALEIAELGGTLRGQPLSGSGQLDWRGGGVGGDLALALGDSRLRLRGTPAAELDLLLALDPLRIDLIDADARGELRGELRLRGAPRRPRIDGALDADGLAFADLAVGNARLTLDIPTADLLSGRFELQADGLVHQGESMGRAQARYAGSGDVPGFSLEAHTPRGAVLLAGEGEAGRGRWEGRLVRFEVSPSGASTWMLDAPAALAFGERDATLAQACLTHAGGGRLCLAADHDDGRQSAVLALRALPLAALAPAGVAGLSVEGAVESELTITRGSDGGLSGGGRIVVGEGGLDERDAPARRLFAWRTLSADLELQPGGLGAAISGELGENGTLRGDFRGGSPFADTDATFEGRLDAVLDDLRLVEHLLPDLAAVQGRLDLGVVLAGRWRAPSASGALQLSSLGGELPALGLRLRDSEITVASDGERVEVDGRLASDGGSLRLGGSIEQAFAGSPSGLLRLQGTDFLAADTPFVRARVSPDLELRWRGERLRVSGRVLVPEARLDLAHLDATVRTSPDVVVVDPAAPAVVAGRGPRLSAQVDVAFGERVTLRGFGFDGRLSGELRVSERSGRATTGRGALDVRGRYRAYGQDLDIQRGRLLFSASPIDNPGLDVRAQRKVDDVTVGIEVRGTARQPVLSVWSQPALDQAEAVSYLVLGRPLRAASSADSGQLSAAAASLGGNLLAGPLGERLGFDTFEVAESASLGGAAFTVGKFLSPSLYLSYGISLFGSGQVFTLRYLLSERVDVEAETGVENRAGINYRLERD